MSTRGTLAAAPKWRPAPEELVRVFQDAVRALPGAELRKMFGYPCSFANSQMFAGLHQECMVLRLPPDDLKRFLELPGATPFEPMPGRAMREYAVVPPSVLESPQQLDEWLSRAFAYALSLPPKQKKVRKTRKGL